MSVVSDDIEGQLIKDSLIAEARSIQALLKSYQQAQTELEKDVKEFVNRDSAEAEQNSHLRKKVALAELELCSNTDFLMFERERESIDYSYPTRRMREGNNELECSKSTKKFSMEEVCKLSEQLQLSTPSTSLSLTSYCDLVEVLLGWRPFVEKNFTPDAEQLCLHLFESLNNDQQFICCCNGLPLFHPELLDPSPPLLDKMSQAIKSSIASIPLKVVASVATQIYSNLILGSSVVTKEKLFSMVDKCARSTNKEVNGLAFSFLGGDMYDNFSLVEERKLVDTQLFRGFFFDNELRVVEHLGPEVDVMCLLGSADNKTLGELGKRKGEISVAVQRRLKEVFVSFHQKLVGSSYLNALDLRGKNLKNTKICLIAAFKRGMLSMPEEEIVSSCTLLDIRPISPTLPFNWHLTWEELCSVGQKSDPEKAVLYNLTRVSVAELNPCDALSSAYFPHINRLLER